MKRTPLRRRTRLRGMSPKRKALNELRRIFVAEQLAAKPWCEARIYPLCTGRAVDVHELKTRARGGSITDPDNVLALCRACHHHITVNPAWAVEHGFMRHSWETR